MPMFQRGDRSHPQPAMERFPLLIVLSEPEESYNATCQAAAAPASNRTTTLIPRDGGRKRELGTEGGKGAAASVKEAEI